MTRDANPQSQSVDDLRARYAQFSDVKIAELRSLGRDTFVSDAVWNAICDEFERRHLAGSTTEEAVQQRRTAEAAAAAVTSSHPPLGARAFQGLIDLVLAAAVAGGSGFVVAVAAQNAPEVAQGAAMILATAIGFFGYQVFFEARAQATPVMQVMGLKVVTTVGGRPSAGRLIARALLRPLGLAGPLWFVLAGTWWGHDVLTGTRIVQADGESGQPSPSNSAV